MRKIVLLTIATVFGLGDAARAVEGAIVPNSFSSVVGVIAVIAGFLIVWFLIDLRRAYDLHREREEASRPPDKQESSSSRRR